MSTKTQNLKRKQKGEFDNIESLKKDKKVFSEGGEAKIVKKSDDKKKTFQQKGDKKDFKAIREQKKQYQNKKMNKTLITVKETEISDKDDILDGNITVGQITQMAEKLWTGKTSKSEKNTIIEKIIKKVGTVIGKLVLKRSGSRAIQACLKHGTEKQQDTIFDCVIEDNLVETIKSKYGVFLALRIIKAMKKQEHKQEFFKVLLKNAYYLVSHVEGAKVIDQYLRHVAKSSEISAIKNVFNQVVEKQHGTENQKQQNKKLDKYEGIDNLAVKIIDKQNHYPIISKHILQLSFPILVAAEREKIIEYLREKVLDLIEDKEGIKLCLDLINYSSAKDRKIIIKNLKDHIVKILKSNAGAFIIIQKLIQSVDDTVILEKQVLKPIKNDFKEIIATKNGFSVISSIFIPQHNTLKTVEKEVKFTTSKKDDNLRYSQIQAIMIEDVYKYLNEIQDLNTVYTNFGQSRFLSSVLKYILKENKKEYFGLVDKVLKDFSSEQYLSSEEDFKDKSLYNHIDAHRIIKNVLTVSGELVDDAKAKTDAYIEKLSQIVQKYINLFVLNRSSIYIVISLIEQTNYKDIIVKSAKAVKLGNQDNKDPKELISIDILKQYL